MRRRVFLSVAVATSTTLFCAVSLAQNAPTVAAASDLQFALTEIANQFQRDTGKSVRLTFGSSGNFVRQIEQGAPFELYFSADEEYVEHLHAKQLTLDAGALYAIGRIVLFAPKGSALQLDEKLDGVRALIDSKQAYKFSIANPEHAPYGRAAQQALEKLDLWQPLQSNLVLGENVSQAAQFVTSGNAAVGIVAYSLVLAPAMMERGTFVLLPDELHLPLRQRMVLLKNASPVAQEFYRYVQAPPARAVLTKYGFVLPGE
jgi:molybdate transport system substrate-binding protein